nr:MAG TPA: hypothetical protein [Caudoviricetes sp.]
MREHLRSLRRSKRSTRTCKSWRESSRRLIG